MMARIRLFGEFRNWNSSGEISVSLQNARTVSDLKASIGAELGKVASSDEVNSLLAVSALAGEDRILLDSENLENLATRSFALLPPVCGG